ncbi:CRISPR-associated endonuclease Cas2 [Candidatus Saccharibacteria bacterium]|nr:CRISPR-associated endonuclease Cas2 [Candidatus Saccharibacteria bacterium]
MDRFSEYRIMWVMCFFDLPTETKIERQRHSEFRKNLLKDGFSRFQLSIYIRHCASVENAEVHIAHVKSFMPPDGSVSILCITDKQFGKIQIFYGRKEKSKPKSTGQLELFL